jgi:hypothetical protein
MSLSKSKYILPGALVICLGTGPVLGWRALLLYSAGKTSLYRFKASRRDSWLTHSRAGGGVVEYARRNL